MKNQSQKLSKLATELDVLLTFQIQLGNIRSQEKKAYLERLATGMIDDLRRAIRFFDKTFDEIVKVENPKDTILNEMVNKMRF